jgi:hypothetical protein
VTWPNQSSSAAPTSKIPAIFCRLLRVLDLIDSILFTAPLMFFYLRFVVGVR